MADEDYLYATIDQFKARVNLKSLPPELQTDDVIEDYLYNASAEVFSYIRCAYAKLIAPYDRAITTKTIDLAYYYLMVKRGFKDTNADAIIANSYQQIIDYLKDVSNRQIILSDINDSNDNLYNEVYVVL